MDLLRNTRFVLQRAHKTSNLVYNKLARNCVEQKMCGLWNTVSFPTFLLEQKKVTFLRKNKKCEIFTSLMDKEVENLDDHGVLKFQDLVDEGMWICLGYPFRPHFTEQSASKSLW